MNVSLTNIHVIIPTMLNINGGALSQTLIIKPLPLIAITPSPKVDIYPVKFGPYLTIYVSLLCHKTLVVCVETCALNHDINTAFVNLAYQEYGSRSFMSFQRLLQLSLMLRGENTSLASRKSTGHSLSGQSIYGDFYVSIPSSYRIL